MLVTKPYLSSMAIQHMIAEVTTTYYIGVDEHAGLNEIQIEDKEEEFSPTYCGHLDNKEKD